MLRVDSLEFVVTLGLLIALLRMLSAAHARTAYALVSAGVYFSLLPNWPSLVASTLFVFWPWVFLTKVRHKPAWSIPLLITIQTATLLWARQYFSLIPTLAIAPWLAHAIAIIGISYIILRQIELVLLVDAEPDTRVSLRDYTAFTIGTFTLLAGPIIPYAKFQAGFVTPREKQSPKVIALAANRIVNGYLKVSVLSPVFFELSSLETLKLMDGSLQAWLLFFYLFPLYIYLNFSGYCDIVIGAGRLARFEIPENFDYPYFATNVQNYWQRWHLTFSHWIRIHLFFPLVRALRSSPLSTLRSTAMPLSVLLTFLIVGLWHGTDPGFAVFGLLHGLAVLAVTPYSKLLDRVLSPGARAYYESSHAIRGLRIAACYHYLCFTMLFFERPFAQMRTLLW